MVKTVIGLFATSAIAHTVVADLENQGFPRDDIRVIPAAMDQTPPEGSVAVSLIEMGMPEKKAVYYSEAVRRGGTLVCVTVDDHMVDMAKTIIDAHGSLDINNQATQWRQGGWRDFGPEADEDVVLVQTTYVCEVPSRERLAS